MGVAGAMRAACEGSPMATEKTLVTADELLRLPADGRRHELVRGELRTMAPAGGEHGIVSGQAARLLGNHVVPNQLGYVLGAETGIRLARDPDTVRAPDAAFIAAGRLPSGRPPAGYFELVPDLVVEVVSPADTAREVEEKVHEWLSAGARLVWVIHPSTRSVTVYRSLADVRVLTEDVQLDGADVLPGFACAVRELFPY
jgi:Uma2 family endonuclease